MKRIATLLVAVALVLVVAVVPTGAVAAPQVQQQNNSTSTAAPSEPTGERIDSSLTLVSSSYDEKAGVARITLRADDHVAVTLSDAGGFLDGGEIARRTVVLESGTSTVELPVTETDTGAVGVSIGTENVLYGEVIRPERALLPGLTSEFSGGQLMASVVVAASVGVGMMVLLLFIVGKQLKKRRPL